MRNLYRISDDEADEYFSFVGFDMKRASASYINEEHDYLVFKISLVEVWNILLPFEHIYFLTRTIAMMCVIQKFNETLRSTGRALDEEFTVDHVTNRNFSRFVREIDNWEVYYMEYCTKSNDDWATTVMHTNGVRIDKVNFHHS